MQKLTIARQITRWWTTLQNLIIWWHINKTKWLDDDKQHYEITSTNDGRLKNQVLAFARIISHLIRREYLLILFKKTLQGHTCRLSSWWIKIVTCLFNLSVGKWVIRVGNDKSKMSKSYMFWKFNYSSNSPIIWISLSIFFQLGWCR